MARTLLPLSAVNLNLLRVLEAVVTARSVSGAAVRLGVSQSAVSHALRELRELFDDPLLERSGHGMALTPFADRVGRRLQRGLAELEKALAEEVAFEPASSSRTFTIAADDHMAAIVLQSMVWMVRREAPEVTFRLVTPAARTMRADLESGEIDVGIGPDLLDEGLHRTPLVSDCFACVVRRDHPEIRGAISLDQLAGARHAVLGRRDTVLQQLEQTLLGAGVRRRVAVEVPYMLLAPTLVPFSDLVLIAPRVLGELFAFGFPLQVLDPPLALPQIRESMYWHPRVGADPAHAWLRGKIVSCVDEFFARMSAQRLRLVGEWPSIPPGHSD